MLANLDVGVSTAELINKDILERMIKAHWEFQQVAAEQLEGKLEPSWDKEKLNKFFNKGEELIELGLKLKVKQVIQQDFDWFWQADYPCKWKFALDNLILTSDKKIGFIDLAKISKRFWGYDLGWVFWPAWHHFDKEELNRSEEHYQVLLDFFQMVYKLAPEDEKQDDKFLMKCHLILFERIIGSFFDFVNNTSHIEKNLSKKEKPHYIKFLNHLLKKTLKKLD